MLLKQRLKGGERVSLSGVCGEGVSHRMNNMCKGPAGENRASEAGSNKV